jgi:NAD(P)-dependent dehydrogenase (short-subunit alcohol dehydrogenase family)
MSAQLAGQVALVTGAGRGIGRAIATALARSGATVVASARTASDLDEVVKTVAAFGGSAHSCCLDVADINNVRPTIDDIGERFGRLDILVNCAGVTLLCDSLDMTAEQWRRVLEVNLRAPFFACQAAGRIMIDRGYGRIINVTSMGARVGWRRSRCLLREQRRTRAANARPRSRMGTDRSHGKRDRSRIRRDLGHPTTDPRRGVHVLRARPRPGWPRRAAR